MSRNAVFPSTNEGREEFARAVRLMHLSGEPMGKFFAKHFKLSETAVRNTSKRLDVPLSDVTFNTKEQRRQALLEQRRDGIPPDVVAHRMNVKKDTVRQWTKEFRLSFKKNTRLGRKQWWWKEIGRLKAEEVPAHAALNDLPYHTAAVMYHELADPLQHLAWDLHGDDFRVLAWTERDYLDAAATYERAGSLEEADLLLGHRKNVIPLLWPEDYFSDVEPEADASAPTTLELPDRLPVHVGLQVAVINPNRRNADAGSLYELRSITAAGQAIVTRVGANDVKQYRTVPQSHVYLASDPAALIALREQEARAEHKPANYSPFDEEAQ